VLLAQGSLIEPKSWDGILRAGKKAGCWVLAIRFLIQQKDLVGRLPAGLYFYEANEVGVLSATNRLPSLGKAACFLFMGFLIDEKGSRWTKEVHSSFNFPSLCMGSALEWKNVLAWVFVTGLGWGKCG